MGRLSTSRMLGSVRTLWTSPRTYSELRVIRASDGAPKATSRRFHGAPKCRATSATFKAAGRKGGWGGRATQAKVAPLRSLSFARVVGHEPRPRPQTYDVPGPA